MGNQGNQMHEVTFNFGLSTMAQYTYWLIDHSSYQLAYHLKNNKFRDTRTSYCSK